MLSCVVAPLVAGSAVSAQSVGASEKLLPETTKGFFAVTNYDNLVDHWNKTQIGNLLADPVMEPFAEDLRRQFRNRWAEAQQRVGLTLEDLRDVPSGELAVALVRPSEDQAGMVVLADVTGNIDEATAMLEKAAANLVRQGAKASRQEVGDTTVMVFELPEEPKPRHVVYFLSGNLLGAGDNLGVIQDIILRMAGNDSPSLAGVPAFAAVQQRCRQHAGDSVPQIRWFVEPIGYLQAQRLAAPEPPKRRRGQADRLEIMQQQGVDAIQGVGGFIDLAVDGYEILHRTAIYAPPPYEKAMRMVDTPDRQDFPPPEWLPFDVATYTSFSWDVLTAFDNFGSLFDALFGEGETGVWEEVLQGLKEDPNGPQIDLREELVRHLGDRITVVTDYQLPITPTSERLLFAIKTRDAEAVAAGLKKTMENDPTVRRREFQGRLIWETVEGQGVAAPNAPRIDVPALEDIEGPPDEDGPPQDDRLLPHAAVTVAHGHLIVASHYDFLVDVLSDADSRRTLGRSVDYQIVAQTIERLGADEGCLQSFSRTDEEYRSTYELIRMGRMPESETMFGRLLNAILGPRQKGAMRDQEIEGEEMPDYQVVRRYLGPAGVFATSESDGWFVVGFMLPK
jgi:hypothetical protein